MTLPLKTIIRRSSLACLLMLAACVSGLAQTPATEPFGEEIAAFEKSDRERMPPSGAVLFIGSSTIRGWRSLAADFPQYEVINRGFGGSFIEHSTRYADRIIIGYKPALIVFYAGGNDLAFGNMTPEKVAADYRLLVEKVHRSLPRTRFAYISIMPNPARQNIDDKRRRANELIEAYSKQDRRLSYIDADRPVLTPSGGLRPELYIEDGLHLNAAGYAVLHKTVAEHLRTRLKLKPRNTREAKRAARQSVSRVERHKPVARGARQ